MKKRIFFTLILLLCLTACSKERSSEQVIPVNNSDNSITTFGVIKCLNTKSIFLPFNTNIKRIFKNEGEEVTRGQSLIEFDLSDYYLQLDRSSQEIDDLKQQLESQTLKLKNLQEQRKIKIDNMEQTLLSLNKEYDIKRGYIQKGASPEIGKLALALEASEKELSVEKSMLSDYKELYNAGAVSLKEYEGEQRNFEAAERKIKEIRLEMDAIMQNYVSEADTLKLTIVQNKSDIFQTESDMANEESEIKTLIQSNKKLLTTAEKGLQKLKDSLENASLEDGRLTNVFNRAVLESIKFNPGDEITAGSLIAKLSDLDSLYIEVGIEEQSIAQVQMGSKVQIIPEMYKTKFYTGTVIFISSVAEQINNETTVTIKIGIDGADKFLIPNANVKVKILPD